jgi:hypothetical protein
MPYVQTNQRGRFAQQLENGHNQRATYKKYGTKTQQQEHEIKHDGRAAQQYSGEHPNGDNTKHL